MAKFQIVRDHLDYKEGDTPTGLTEDQQKYLVAMGVATFGKTDSPSLKQKEELQEQAAEEKEQKASDITTGNKTSAAKKTSKK